MQIFLLTPLQFSDVIKFLRVFWTILQIKEKNDENINKMPKRPIKASQIHFDHKTNKNIFIVNSVKYNLIIN